MPLTNGANGHGASGRFTVGNRAAAGRAAPHAARVAALRAALLKAIKPADVRAIAKALIEKARAGDLRAIRELFDRVLGAPEKTAWTDDNLHAAAKATLDNAQRLDNHGLSRIDQLFRSIGE